MFFAIPSDGPGPGIAWGLAGNRLSPVEPTKISEGAYMQRLGMVIGVKPKTPDEYKRLPKPAAQPELKVYNER